MALKDKVKGMFTNKQELVITQNITTSTDEQDIIDIIKRWQSTESSEIKGAILIDWKRNYNYFTGIYDRDKMNLKINKSNIVVNKIFSSIKSVTPFVTSKPAEPVIYPRKYEIEEDKTIESKKLAIYWQEIIKKIYENSNLQALNEANTINRYLYKIWILRYWIKDNKIFTRLVDPKDIIFDTWAKQFSEQEYIWEKLKLTVWELVALYPNKKDLFLRKTKGKLEFRIDIIEWWTKDTVIVSMDNELLEVKDNPFKNEWNTKLNYYDDAPIPFVALNVFNTGITITDDVSEIDLTYKIQDSLNDLARQILDNAKYNWNPITVWLWLSWDQLEDIKRLEAGDSIVLPSGWDDIVDIKYLQAVPLPPYIMNMYTTLQNEIDAIFWTQATFRWEFDWVQSWVSRDILRTQAWNSLAQLSRWIERMMNDLYKGWLHLILVFADDQDFVEKQIRPILWTSTDEFLELLFNDEDWIEITVKAWTILPDDKVTEWEQAMELAKMNKISMELLYERIGISNPEKEAEKFALEQTVNAIKSQHLQLADQQAQAQAQQEQQAKQQSQAVWQNELASIQKEIDNLDGWATQSQWQWGQQPRANISITTPTQ